MEITNLLFCAGALGLSSLIGSAIGLLIKRIPHNWNDTFLGFCAGMMLAASIVCLILPSIEMTPASGWWQIVLGIVCGVDLIGALDRFTPHLHHLSGMKEEERHANNASLNRTLLFVMAIALHKLPEGMATGVSFNGDQDNAMAIAFTIALQNLPEGMVVITPLLVAGVRFLNTLLIGVADISAAFLPFLLAMAGGAMLYVISDEMIPETHSHGFQKQATYALVAGVVCMLFIEALV